MERKERRRGKNRSGLRVGFYTSRKRRLKAGEDDGGETEKMKRREFRTVRIWRTTIKRKVR
jgi:hypothetical protein